MDPSAQSCFPNSVPYFLQKLIEWTSSNSFRVAGPHLQPLLNYVSTLKVDSDLAVRVYGKLGGVEGYCASDGFHFSVETVDGALQELGELFRVPKLHHLKDNNVFTPSQLVAGFITFLLQLLDLHAPSSVSSEFKVVKHYLVPELKFLVAILGDAPFEAPEHEQVQSILAGFEQVANEAGLLLHSLTFSPYNEAVASQKETKRKIKRNKIDPFLEHINLLSSNIVKLLHSLPSTISFPQSNDSRDSLFIVHNLIRGLMNRVTRTRNDKTSDDTEVVEEQEDIEKPWDLIEIVDRKVIEDVEDIEDLRMLYVRLRFLLPFLKGVNAPQHLKTEFNQLLQQIRDKGCEAEYLIKRDLPLWYRTIRLIHVAGSLALIRSRLQEMKTAYDSGALNVVEECSVQPPLKLEDYWHNDIRIKLETEERDILDQLVGGCNELQIITIFGMPGIGKTTLAKELYNHDLISHHFDTRAWSTVSQTHQKKNLLIEISNCLEGNSGKTKAINNEDEDEESLLLKIYQSLKGRRYFIVMDDLWDLDVWEDLQRYFPDDENGSRVLFTSRDKDVAPSGSIKNELPLLSDDQCWELLQNKVFHGEVCPKHLEKIGKEIAKKCCGLPLTTVVLAGVLSDIDREKHVWKNVGESLNTHMLSGESNSTMQILEFSYKHLSKHLKDCFLYFGVFREDERIYARDLKWLWIAEGFIPEDDEEMRAERLAEDYLMKLIDKSLVIVTEKRLDGGVKVCVVHDLLRELCLRIAEREKFRKGVGYGNDVEWGLRLSRKLVPGDGYAEFSYLWPYTRWLSRLYRSTYCIGKMEVLLAMNETNRWVKMLSTYDYGVPIHSKFPDSDMMLESLHMFENLEFLILPWGYGQNKFTLSSNILKMVKLKYIRIESPFVFEGDWDTCQTTNLEYLSDLLIKKPFHIEILRCSPHLRTLKCDYSMENEANRCVDLHFLTQLQSLTFSGSIELTEINLPSSIKKLHLMYLELTWETVSVIGALPNLESLKLELVSFVGERWGTSDGQFQKLKFLKMFNLSLIEWNVTSNEHFPKLQILILEDCDKLEEIPCEVGEIDTLKLISIRECNKNIEECGRKIQQEQEEWGNQQLRVVIY